MNLETWTSQKSEPPALPDQPPGVETGSTETEPRWAGFFTRGVAFLMDLLIINALFAILGLAGGAAMRLSLKTMHLETPSEELIQFMLDLYLWVWFLLFCAYFIFWLSNGGQTPAKKSLNMRVLTKDHKPLTWQIASMRTLGYFISGPFLLGLGFILVIFHPQKRALHDLLAGTVVIRNRSG